MLGFFLNQSRQKTGEAIMTSLHIARLRILRALIAYGYGDGPLVMFDDGLPLCFLRPSPMHLRRRPY
jgi:hypothetical protein